MSSSDTRSFEERYKACYVDFAAKIGCGLLIGSMIGCFFMRSGRRWPTFIGGGLGFGMAYANCEKNLNEYLESLEPKVCQIKKTS